MKEKFLYYLLKGLAATPLWLMYLFSDLGYFIIYRILGYRRKVVRDNLTTSFPEKNLKEISKIERQFYHFLCDQMVETLKLFNISDKQLMKRVEVNGADIVNLDLKEGKNVVLFMGHYGNWEWVQEISRYFLPGTFMASIYHQLNDPVWNNLFIKLRSRWGNQIVEMKKSARVLLNKKNSPWVCGFISDQWTWHPNANSWLMFLNHPTGFIYGSEEIGMKTGATFYYLEMKPVKRGHYQINMKPLHPADMEVPYPYTREFWKEFEKTIQEKPAYWLWSHKRWK